ncbi:MAG: tripartite tricarboxylate transporter TctB family protein [Staphylothermus sp.]|nr:tripartite tricarboxylate transporter TctB family protein [Staphylothermus sp.]
MRPNCLIGELILGILFMFVGIIFYFDSQNINVLGLGIFGPSLFPMLISAGLALLSFVLVVKCSLNIIKEKSFTTSARPLISLNRKNYTGIVYTLILIVLVITYVYLVNILGYLLSTMLLTGILAKLLRAKNEEAILLAISFSFLMYALFRFILKVPLPAGVLGW